MTDKKSYEYITLMTRSGVALGSLIGSVGGALLLSVFNRSVYVSINELDISIIGELLVGGLGGGIFGIMYGFFAGLLSGILMHVVTQIWFQEVYRQQVYGVTMAIVTICATSFVLIVLPFWLMFGWTGFAVCMVALLFAIHASQRVASEYLRESDGRKRKVK